MQDLFTTNTRSIPHENHEMPLQSLLANYGFSEDSIKQLLTIFYLAGALDGQIKAEKSIQGIAELAITRHSVNSLQLALQTNLYQRFRGQQERLDIPVYHCDNLSSQEAELLEAFRNLGILPTKQEQVMLSDYAFGLVFGATETVMQQRLEAILRQGSFDNLVILTGLRDLWIDHEESCREIVIDRIRANKEEYTREDIAREIDKLIISHQEKGFTAAQIRTEVQKILTETYTISWPTEVDAAKKVYKNIKDKYKKSNLSATYNNISFIEAPKKPDGSRPDTLDTVIVFANTYQDALSSGTQRVLAMSSYPHVCEQEQTLRILPNNVQATVLGHNRTSTKSTARIESLLAGLAGLFYKINQVNKILN